MALLRVTDIHSDVSRLMQRVYKYVDLFKASIFGGGGLRLIHRIYTYCPLLVISIV